MSGAFTHCQTCQFYLLFDGVIHLCTLPSECAPQVPADDDGTLDHCRDAEERKSAYVGTDCDVMRRMDAFCGPRARLWSSRA